MKALEPSPAPPSLQGRDPREDEPWFVELPERAKQDFRERWAEEERRAAVDAVRQRQRVVRCRIEGALLLVLIQTLVYRLELWPVLVSIALGAALGTAWQRWRTGRSASALLGLLAFLLVRVVCGMENPVQAICGMTLVICLSMALAIPRESEFFGA